MSRQTKRTPDIQNGAVTPVKVFLSTGGVVLGRFPGTSGTGQEIPFGLFSGTSIGGGSSIFQRNLSGDLFLLDGECSIVTEYIDASSYSIDLSGNSTLEIL